MAAEISAVPRSPSERLAVLSLEDRSQSAAAQDLQPKSSFTFDCSVNCFAAMVLIVIVKKLVSW